ncbi:MAG: guanylate kinase, partial [Clostridia bacterium]|nr:guanylate kinase [Clostridia bacterium]
MRNNREGLLIVISGPSGVGKGTVCKGLLENNKNFKVSVSATTREPRKDEIDGVNYFFKTKEEFERMIENNEFLEYMDVFGMNYYGTPRAYVEEELSAGNDIILEIDVKGAMRVKESFPDAVTVFIAPPSMSTLKTR